MTDPAPNQAPEDALLLGDFLDAGRVVINLEVSSRKRLFEQMATLASSEAGPDVDTVLRSLTKREKLGCTGIGNGIALPHGRIESLAAPIIAVARLKEAIQYDAPDGEPVWLAVCLLVPVDADETHLRLLATLATRFSTPGFADQLKKARSAAALVAHLKAAP